ncbi:MAG: hypothetical protein K6E79_00935 [Pseudobutyrivibrio sp.]|nr:hypothetical protein [Pseudobutyrivibrio sp.]
MEMDPILNSVGHAKLAPAGKIYIGKLVDKDYSINIDDAKQRIAEGNLQSLNDMVSFKSGTKIDKTNLDNSYQTNSETKAATLELSNTKVIEKSQTYKAAGSSSPRESWENDALTRRNESQPSAKSSSNDLLEIMRFDAPDLYARYMELRKMANDCHVHREVNVYKWVNDNEIDVEKYDDVDEETVRNLREKYKENCVALYTYDHSPESYKKAEPFLYEATKLRMQWESERCMSSGTFSSPTIKQFTTIDVLSKAYSDSEHDTSINFYSKDEDTKPTSIFSGASLWKYSTKFNLLLTTDILNAIANGDKSTASNWMRRIDEVVKNLKDIEKAYQGSHSFLRFGAIFNGDKVTYHANWSGCDNKHGIESDTPEGLLKIINN